MPEISAHPDDADDRHFSRSGRRLRPACDRLEDRLVLSTPGFSIGDVTVTEGNSGSTAAVFTVTLSEAPKKTTTVNFATADATATAGNDYLSTRGTLGFAKGQTAKTISVPILGDLLDEPDESFTLTLSGANGATIARAMGRATIVDDDPAPAVSVGDASVSEGDAGTVSALLTVSLSAPSGKTVTVAYATADGTAAAGSDYTSTSGVVTFAPGETAKTIAVPILGDVRDEADETLSVNLSSPTNAAIADGQGLVTIVDDDPTPSLAISNPSISEGDSGTRDLVFTVTLSAPSGRTVSASFAAADGTAAAGSDYVATSGTLTFAPGETVKSVAVPILGDTTVEPDEWLSLALANVVNATTTGAGTGTILNDDVQPPPSVSIDDVTVTEGDSGTSYATFTVRLSSPSAQTVTIDYATADGSALSGSDYTAVRGTITFAPGKTVQTLAVPILSDLVYEPTESFSMLLSNAVGATIADGQGVATILDNDPAPLTFSIDDAQILEGNSGTRSLVFHIHLSAASTGTEWMVLSTHSGTATDGSDYTGIANYGVTFLPGVTEQTISIPILGDLIAETDETFTVTIDRASRAISDGLAVGTILNDDLG